MLRMFTKNFATGSRESWLLHSCGTWNWKARQRFVLIFPCPVFLYQDLVRKVPSSTWFCIISGYLEDRRPASNMDPYVVISLLAETTILWQPTLEAEARAAKELQLQVWGFLMVKGSISISRYSCIQSVYLVLVIVIVQFPCESAFLSCQASR